ncbi:hypothetical protein [Flavobacterium sp. WV_118_3]|jgi:hypothetical protein
MITEIVCLDKGWNLFWFCQDNKEPDSFGSVVYKAGNCNKRLFKMELPL